MRDYRFIFLCGIEKTENQMERDPTRSKLATLAYSQQNHVPGFLEVDISRIGQGSDLLNVLRRSVQCLTLAIRDNS